MDIYLDYDPEVDTPIYSRSGEKLSYIPRDKKTSIYTLDGMRLSKRTLKLPQKKGFALEEQKVNANKVGRPKNSRTKSRATVKEAIKTLEAHTIEAAELIVNIMRGNEKEVGSDIRLADRQSAARFVIEQPAKMKKNLKEEGADPSQPKPVDTTAEEVITPLISLTVAE
jgi:hypothetical protein